MRGGSEDAFSPAPAVRFVTDGLVVETSSPIGSPAGSKNCRLDIGCLGCSIAMLAYRNRPSTRIVIELAAKIFAVVKQIEQKRAAFIQRMYD